MSQRGAGGARALPRRRPEEAAAHGRCTISGLGITQAAETHTHARTHTHTYTGNQLRKLVTRVRLPGAGASAAAGCRHATPSNRCDCKSARHRGCWQSCVPPPAQMHLGKRTLVRKSSRTIGGARSAHVPGCQAEPKSDGHPRLICLHVVSLVGPFLHGGGWRKRRGWWAELGREMTKRTKR